MTKATTNQIPDGWQETTLAELMTFSNGRTSPDRQFGGEYPVYGANGIIGYSEETNSEEDTLIVGRVGAYCGSVYYSTTRCWITDNAIRGQARNNANPHYTFYLLGTLHLNSRAGGSGHPLLNQSILNAIEVVAPEKPEQKAIADVLSSLDDKIELLRKQNETLEAIAQTIFKEWFVNFNFPNKTGKPYKDSGGKMIDSELGEIPEGWRVGTYSNVVEVSTGKGLKKEFLSEKGQYLVLGANGIIGRTDEYLLDADLILTGRVGTLGTVHISHNKVWISDNVLISKASNKEYFHFAFFTLKHFNFESLNRGSTQPLITQTDLKSVDVIIPNEGTLLLFGRTAEVLFSKIHNNHDQIKTLIKLRDTLLPQLMSGQVRVKGN